MTPVDSGSSWIFVIEEQRVQDGTVTPVFPKGRQVLLIRQSGQLHALSGTCAHMGCSMAEGNLNGHTLRCPCHDWTYDIRTGEFKDAREIRIPIYPWRVEDGKIYINIDEGGRP
ncbi:MAG TPA: Rieske (2Fe-2S) protein [Nitrospiria bacterium]|nr:Rieske (2Fe-2S) protein [Nitrospiria bacterium]